MNVVGLQIVTRRVVDFQRHDWGHGGIKRGIQNGCIPSVLHESLEETAWSDEIVNLLGAEYSH